MCVLCEQVLNCSKSKKTAQLRGKAAWEKAKIPPRYVERRSQVWGSVVGPFSHVAFLLSCVVRNVILLCFCSSRSIR